MSKQPKRYDDILKLTECTHCGKSFTHDKYLEHINQKHLSKTTTNSCQCGESFPFFHQLAIHHTQTHSLQFYKTRDSFPFTSRENAEAYVQRNKEYYDNLGNYTSSSNSSSSSSSSDSEKSYGRCENNPDRYAKLMTGNKKSGPNQYNRDNMKQIEEDINTMEYRKYIEKTNKRGGRPHPNEPGFQQ